MTKSAYEVAKGCIVSYKQLYEPLLFNELNEKCENIKLYERGKISSAFIIHNYNEIVKVIKKDGFIFMQHIHPFILDCTVTGSVDDFLEIIKMLKEVVQYIKKDDDLVVQCRIDSDKIMEFSNRELTNLISDDLRVSGFNVNPKEAKTCVSLTVLKNRAYIGISNLDDNVSTWTGGVLFYSNNENILCRAEFKIEEAFEVFKINIDSNLLALDLGAAPGGWSHFLSEKGIYVDAVDPACLDDRVLSCDKVKHYRMTAQEFSKNYPDKCYDIIVNDMKMDTNESIDIICEMSKQLKNNGVCILTLKLPKQNVQRRINIAKAVLSKKFAIVKMRQLYYNRSEVTIYMKNRIG